MWILCTRHEQLRCKWYVPFYHVYVCMGESHGVLGTPPVQFLSFSCKKIGKNLDKQECIPVKVSAWGGVCPGGGRLPRGWMSAREVGVCTGGGCLHGGCLPGGVSAKQHYLAATTLRTAIIGFALNSGVWHPLFGKFWISHYLCLFCELGPEGFMSTYLSAKFL